MSDRYDNWEDREERALKAKLHTEEMERRYGAYISRSVKYTDLYNPGFSMEPGKGDRQTTVSVVDSDSVGAVFGYHGLGREAVLNFASYKKPGGMFLAGSRAQEESLCHESVLYNVLRTKKAYYEWNGRHVNDSLYENRALYSRDVVFVRGGTAVLCDVITCAAPNRTAAKKYAGVSDARNSEALRSRIGFVLDIAKNSGVYTLVLGAYGCGVFGQDPREVASVFRECLEGDYAGVFGQVVFAVPKRDTDKNHAAFLSVFGA